MRPNDEYAYIHEPGYRKQLQGVDVIINSHGLRGPEFEDVKPPGKKRVLILGDSVVFGWGVPEKNIFALELQRLFSRTTPAVEVIPAGVGSWNTRTEYEYLRSTAINFKPDVVVLFIVENDLRPKNTGRTDVRKELLFKNGKRGKTTEDILWKALRKSVGQSYLVKYIRYFVKIRSNKQAQVEENSPRWKDASLALDGIIKLCHENGADFIVYLYGSKSTVMENAVLNCYNKYLESIGEHAFLLPEVLFKESKYRNSLVDKHPNAAGHMIIAQEIFQSLLPRLTDKRISSRPCSMEYGVPAEQIASAVVRTSHR